MRTITKTALLAGAAAILTPGLAMAKAKAAQPQTDPTATEIDEIVAMG